MAERVFQVKRLLRTGALVVLLIPSGAVAAQDRLPPLAADKMTEEQKKAVSEIAAQNNGTLHDLDEGGRLDAYRGGGA